ncbi:cytochrome c-type biogenesis protein [Aurantimonas sp. A2-1-M11]|uniref:cytochrome c-type biogenesis protein n=1 Tax=Aurantimonas sp. A2-1-M11 TaxID=3113712 RepID=UPI002F91CDAD
MRGWRSLAASLALAVLVMAGGPATGPVLAVTPDEVLSDPALESRARDLSAGLRCLVCQNQSIDDSDADLAKDLRLLVRERLVAGDTNDEVINYLVSRYGEFVLLKPRFDWATLALWGTPIVVLLAGVGFAIVTVRGRRKATTPTALSPEEEAAIADVVRARD